MKSIKTIVCAGLALGVLSAGAMASPEDDMAVFQDSFGQLIGEFDFAELPLLVPPVPTGSSVSGWVADDPGYFEGGEDEPDEGLFAVSRNANIAFELVGTSNEAMKVWDPLFNAVLAPTDQFVLGIAFDEHPFWHIDSDASDFDPFQTTWWVDFKLVDLSGIHGDSPVYRFEFTNVPAPGAGALLAGAMVIASRRRRA